MKPHSPGSPRAAKKMTIEMPAYTGIRWNSPPKRSRSR